MVSNQENLNFQLNVRITERENKALKFMANATGQPQTELVRALLRPTLQTVSLAMQVQNIELSS